MSFIGSISTDSSENRERIEVLLLGRKCLRAEEDEVSAVFSSGCHCKVLAMDCHRGPYDSFHKNSSMHFT